MSDGTENQPLPKEIVARWDGVDDDCPWLHAAALEDKSDLAEQDEDLLVGIYELVKTTRLVNTTEIVSVSPPPP